MASRGEVMIRGGQSGDYLRFTPLPELSLSSFEVAASVSGRVVTNEKTSTIANREQQPRGHNEQEGPT
jgi:hypothetical protein